MKAENFLLQKYFDRIGFSGEAKPDILTVTEMMRRQLFSVPFENLDVQAKKVVSMVPEEIVEKIIERKRGGYCYEVNGLFAMALEELGVVYRFVAARPMYYPARRPRTHMAIVAALHDEDWLFDLGFGSYGIRAPLRLSRLDIEVKQDYDSYMLSMSGDDGYLLKAFSEGAWVNQYAFDLSRQEWIDFVPANYFNSTHPDTIFTKKLLVVLYNPQGRQILFGDELTTVYRGHTEKKIVDLSDINLILLNTFGLIKE
jgi:N-hydroxyarylamine O-acetyltransferase